MFLCFAEDYLDFDALILRPNAEFEIAFRLFDEDGDGLVNINEFKRVISELSEVSS